MVEIYALPGFAEPLSCWTHLIGAFFSLVMTMSLIFRRPACMNRTAAYAIFGIAVVLLLSMSGVYHLLPRGSMSRDVLQRLDHAAIYVLIAATITSVHLLAFEGFKRWGVITLAWVFAAIAIFFKTMYFTSFPEWLSLTTYLAFGWLGVLTGLWLWFQKGVRLVKPLVYGGIAYTAGALLEFFGEPVLVHGVIGPHEIFHLTVLLGISYHWKCIQYAGLVCNEQA